MTLGAWDKNIQKATPPSKQKLQDWAAANEQATTMSKDATSGGGSPNAFDLLGFAARATAAAQKTSTKQAIDEIGKPPSAPDLTDELIRRAGSIERDRLKTGRTRRSTFLTGESPNKTVLGG